MQAKNNNNHNIVKRNLGKNLKNKVILLTRSIDDNQELSYEMHLCGAICVLEPMLTYVSKYTGDVLRLICGANNIVITSKYATAILVHEVEADLLRQKKYFVVGNSSAKLLADNGISVAAICKNAKELYSLLYESSDKFLYLSSNEITMEMPSNAERIEIYNTIYTEQLSPQTLSLIYERSIDCIMFFSSNIAKAFIEIVISMDLVDFIKNVTILCMSDKIACLFRESRISKRVQVFD